MNHIPSLIHDLAIILGLASLISILFKKINQPVVLGYILVGFLVSPHVPIFPTITNEATIKIWAELGVIFLLFALGLEFSFRKLLRQGFSPLITGTIEISGMIVIGFYIGKYIGLKQIECFFLGGILSISSTTIILKTFEEKKIRLKKYASHVLGILIIEDLAAILIMVFLTGVATTNKIDGFQIAESFIRLLLFLVVWFVSGMVVIPSLLKKVRPLLNDETILILSLGLCLCATLLASAFGFSSALGAFLIGSLLAETRERKRIEKLVHSIKDLFGAIFFVSVGILINPEHILNHWPLILLLTFTVIFGKIFFITIGSIISGLPLKTSLQTGISMAQIGEFSFIIAGLGMSLSVTNSQFFPLAVAVSILTTFTTPYLVLYSEKISILIERNVPKKIIENIYRYFSSTQIVQRSSAVKTSIVKYFIHSLIQISIFMALSLFINKILYPKIQSYFESSSLIKMITYICTVLLSSPFMWAVIKDPAEKYIHFLKRAKKLAPLWFSLVFLSHFIFLTLITFQFSLFYTKTWMVSFSLLGFIFIFKIFSYVNNNIYQSLENLFFTNFNANNDQDAQSKIFIPDSSEPWDIQLTEIKVNDNFKDNGKTLEELKIREQFGVSIALIQRYDQSIPAPMKYERIFSSDLLSVIGNEQQIANFSDYLNQVMAPHISNSETINHLVLEKILIHPNSPLIGKSIHLSGIREKTFGLVIGIEREHKRIINPDSNLVFLENDILWITGSKDKLRILKN